MARRTDLQKINPYLLCLVAALVMSAGFLMGPFPVLIFAGVAPLFALADHADGEHFWNRLELVGVALVIALFAAHSFHLDKLVAAILQAIALTFAFAAFTFSKENLGARLGKLPLILFILTIEYLALKAGWGSSFIFLADAMRLQAEWLRWTPDTGYLGTTLWILVANLLLYAAALRGRVSIPFLIFFVITVTGPIVYSYTLDAEVVEKQQMLDAYQAGPAETGDYFTRGEWIPRTAAWVSALIVLFAFVKSYTRKK
jgi:hypothetical protein